MTTSLRAAVVQMTSSADRDRNVATAERLVRRAAADGATLIVLPEKWNAIDADARQAAHGEALDGPSLTAVGAWARDLGVTIVAGSISERVTGDQRAANTCAVIGPDGAVQATYRKLHLFDVEVGGHVYRESAGTVPGDRTALTAVSGRRLGLAICYDLRFPELFRVLTAGGAEIVTLPAAFTAITGAAHWDVLVRARAIENQVFVLAAGQVGPHATGTSSFGHSMIVDPWGTVIATVAGGEGVAVADLDFAEQAALRSRLPVAAHRRLTVSPEVHPSA